MIHTITFSILKPADTTLKLFLLTTDDLEMSDLVQELLAAQVSDFKSKFHRFELLDQVFTGFITTATYRGRHYSLDEILANSKFHKTCYRFEYYNIPYRCTVFTYQGHDADWINIKLPNNGFHYFPKSGHKIDRHNSKGWILLNDERCGKYLSSMRESLKDEYDRVYIFYNYNEQRLDLKFYPRDSSDAPHLIITFEPGYPYMDETYPATLL